MVQEAREGTPSEQRFKDSVVVRTMKPYAKLKGSRKFLHHQDELKFLEKYSSSCHKFDWLQDTDEQGPLKDTGLHLDLPAQPATVTAFRKVIVPVDDTPKTLDMEVMGTREDLEDFGEVAQPSEWGLHTSASEVATQTWTVNSEAAVERLQPLPSPVQAGPQLWELLQDAGGGADSHEEEEEEPAVFPCIECSIYFQHKEHLLEHMSQHRRAPGQEPPAGLAPLACSECGWAFTEPAALEQHWQLHQASREKIIEEIQKLKQLPGDEGREARLQCPECVFGTNSSRAFLQHAKLHVRGSPPSRQTKDPSMGGSPVLDASTLVYPSYGDSSGPDTCVHCGFTAPSKSLLREHMRLAHAHAHWEEDGEAFEDPTDQPGTSQDAYTHLPDTAAMDYFSRSEPLLASVWQESSSAYDPGLAFGPDYQQSGMRDCPFLNSSQQSPGKLAFPSPVASASYSIQLNRNKSTVHLQRAEGKRHPWSEEEEEDDEDVVLTSEMDFAPENGAFPPLATPSLIPPPALELKQTFQDALRAAGASETQQQQLQGMVPIVLMAKLRPQVIAAATLASPKLPPEELELRSTHPLDLLLLDTPLGGSLGLDTLLEGDPAMALKHEERKCPYCPDRFHNGIGLANHVRGHLNRVGVSYNVRHFISAEEVKAIERRFSFQKRKKKGRASALLRESVTELASRGPNGPTFTLNPTVASYRVTTKCW